MEGRMEGGVYTFSSAFRAVELNTVKVMNENLGLGIYPVASLPDFL